MAHGPTKPRFFLTDGTEIALVNASGQLEVNVNGTLAATQSGTWNVTDISGTVSLPTGASTSAKQDTIIGHLDGVEGLLTTIDADTGNISTKIDTIAGDTTDIEAAVELIDDTVVTLGTDTYTEATSKGLVIGGVRRDADTTLVNTTNEFAPLQVDASGRLKVEAFSGETLPVSLASVPSHAVTNAGTFAVQVDGNALTALQKIDDPVLVDDAAFTPATSSVVMAGFEFDDTTPDSVNEGDAGAARMSANRNIYTTIRDAAGNERGVNVTAGNALTVDASATTQPISHAALTELAAAIDTEVQVDIVGALPAGTNAIGKLAANSGVDIGDVDVTSVIPGTGATNLGKAIDTAVGATDTGIGSLAKRVDTPATITPANSDWAPLQISSTGRLWVDASGAAVPVTDNSGSLTVDFGTATSGGYSIYTNIDLDPTGVNPKGSAGQIYGWYISNASSVTVYVKVYNKATAPTGSDTPVMTLPLYAGQTANMSFPHGIAFGTGIGLRATTGVATADTGDPGANAVICNILYA